MDTQRLVQIVIMELTADNLKLEHELETTMNGDLEIEEKTKKIKFLLSKIVNTEASLAKFASMVSNNNDLTQNKDGQN